MVGTEHLGYIRWAGRPAELRRLAGGPANEAF